MISFIAAGYIMRRAVKRIRCKDASIETSALTSAAIKDSSVIPPGTVAIIAVFRSISQIQFKTVQAAARSKSKNSGQ